MSPDVPRLPSSAAARPQTSRKATGTKPGSTANSTTAKPVAARPIAARPIAARPIAGIAGNAVGRNFPTASAIGGSAPAAKNAVIGGTVMGHRH